MIFDDQHIYLNITFYKDYSKIKLIGNVKNSGQYKNILLMAPNPIDRMSNYSGSGLPFPNNEIAFQNTPNKIDITGTGVINTEFQYPNSFYMPDGINKIVSSVFLQLTDNNNNVFHLYYKLHDINSLRTLVNRNSRTGPEFYGAKDYLLPIGTAENVMRAYANIKIENDIA
tara:strand:- start:4367 stop:4879 length:513 start_codon:yes stop_codon:yes gene_type:complete